MKHHLIAGFLCLSLALANQAAESAGSDWPQFLGPTRNGVYPGELAHHWPKEGPPVLWKKKVGQGFSGPVVRDGRVILFHRLGDQERLECLDAKDGRTIWQFEYPTHYHDDFGFDEGPRATPAIDGDSVYSYGAEGSLHCVDFNTGKPVWAVDAKKDLASAKGWFGRACSPLIEGNAVIVNIGGGPGAGIVAFDKKTGRVLWKSTDDEASYASPVAATIHDKRYLFIWDRAGLAALQPSDGHVYFEFPFRSPMDASVNAATPLVVGDEIFLSACYETGATLLRFHEEKPESIWVSQEALSNHYATSVYHDGFLFGFDGRQEQGQSLRCVDFKTGNVRWSEPGFHAGTVLLARDHLLVMAERGELLLVPASPNGFHAEARAQLLPFLVRAYPALAQGFFYARSKDRLVCIDLRP